LTRYSASAEEYSYNNEEESVWARSKTQEHIMCDLWDEMNRVEPRGVYTVTARDKTLE